MRNSTDFYNSVYSVYWSHKRPLDYLLTDYDSYLLSLFDSPPSRCLDACMGNGIPFIRELSNRGHSVDGFDISSFLLHQAQVTFPSLNFYESDLHSFHSFEYYDVAYVFHALHLVPQPYKALNSFIDSTPNVKRYIFEFPSIYNTYNSAWFYYRQDLFSSKYNIKRLQRAFKNTTKYLLGLGVIDKSDDNLDEPLSLFRVLDSIHHNYSVHVVRLHPFHAKVLPSKISVYDILDADRVIIIVER